MFHMQIKFLILFTFLVVMSVLLLPREHIQNAVFLLHPAYMEKTIYESSIEDIWSEEEKERAVLLQEHIRFLMHYRGHDVYSALFEKFMNMENSDKQLLEDLEKSKYHPHWKEFEEALKWWTANKIYDPHVMIDLLKLVKGKLTNQFNKTDTERELKPYRTCAVVGNSGILLSKSYGNLIDTHDIVMRINNARTDGFEQHVGSKTNISFMNTNVLGFCSRGPFCNCYRYGNQVPIIVYLCQVKHLIDVSFCQSSQKAPIIVTDPKFDTLCMRIAKYYSLKHFFETKEKSVTEWNRAHDGMMFHYSSGMQAVMLALGICENVDLFGFGKAANAKHHYHTFQRREFDLHDYDAEYIFYNDLVQKSIDSIPFLNQAGFLIPPVQIFQ